MRKALLFVVVAAVSALPAAAQQDIQYSMYMMSPLYYNPGYAGVEGVTKITAMHRSQWVNYGTNFDGRGGAPTTQLLSISAPILRIRSGVGIHLLNDNLGPNLNNIQAQAAYAYHLAIGESKLSFGIRAGIHSQSINKRKYRANDNPDPIIEGMEESQIRPDISGGVFYRAEKYFAGVSFTHLTKAEFDWGADPLKNALEPHMFVTAGYDYEFNYDLIITFSALFKSNTGNFKGSSVEASAIGVYRDKYWGGLSYRQGDAGIAILGISLLKDNSLRIGYAFDYTYKGADAKTPMSHEVLLSYSLPAGGGEGKKVIRTPRFRHE